MGAFRSQLPIWRRLLSRNSFPKNRRITSNRQLESEEKMMKSAIVCVFALILLAINVEGATLCYDGCTAEKGKGVEKCRTVKCNGGGMCVSYRRPDSITADGCTYIKIAPGCHGDKSRQTCYCLSNFCNKPQAPGL